ncbi:unnamed protein product [Rhizoctonia solani]|uniref:Uncharacterized protein n=1 Tax=Rhizoctonia solani TaxID=456999 RepID=A0A8H2WU59_9AGAM|nr:unnamed protein product [Rhizoctonia solani]
MIKGLLAPAVITRTASAEEVVQLDLNQDFPPVSNSSVFPAAPCDDRDATVGGGRSCPFKLIAKVSERMHTFDNYRSNNQYKHARPGLPNRHSTGSRGFARNSGPATTPVTLNTRPSEE